MPSPAYQYVLPRRVVRYYLLFSLLALATLGAGLTYTVQQFLTARSDALLLSHLDHIASTIRIEYVRKSDGGLQATAQRVSKENDLAYCEVVSQQGTYLATTRSDAFTTRPVEPVGKRWMRGEIETILYADERGRSIREVRMPLAIGDERFGSLRIARRDPKLTEVVTQFALHAPWALILPFAMTLCGGVVLALQTIPVARIDSQLRRLARDMHGELEAEPIPPRSAIALGWNRIADRLEELRKSNVEGEGATPPADSTAAGESVLASLPEGIAITTETNVVQSANGIMESMCGVEHGELTESDLLESIPWDRRTDLAERFVNKSANRVSVEFSSRLHSDRILQLHRFPLRGAERGYLWRLEDITHRKQSEKARDEFIEVATHELRTPLANIKAYAETLADMEDLDFESQKEFINTINTEATRLARFVDDLLSVSSMEVGSLALQRQRVDLQRLLDEVIAKVKPLMEQKSLRFEYKQPAKLPEVHVDKDKLAATLVNLLGNAAKYTPDQGQVDLTVSLREQDLCLAVKDTGVGISPEEQAKVFEKFFRSGNPAVQDQVGTGLGLSLAREIVRLHGGDIEVSSELERGSTFTIVLPLRQIGVE